MEDVARYTKDPDSMRYSKRFETQAKKWAPYLSDGPMNPWRFMEARHKWELYYCNRNSNPPRRTDTSRTNAAKVKALLKTGEALDPKYPYLTELRVSLALANGRRAQALSLAKHLDHATFFDHFYGCEYGITPPW